MFIMFIYLKHIMDIYLKKASPTATNILNRWLSSRSVLEEGEYS